MPPLSLFGIGAVCALVLALLLFAIYRFGAFMGRAQAVNTLIDATDSEGWNWAHYLRARWKELRSNKSDKPARQHRDIRDVVPRA